MFTTFYLAALVDHEVCHSHNIPLQGLQPVPFPDHVEARLEKHCFEARVVYLPSHQLTWKCKKALSKRKVVFLQGSMQFHVSWWEGIQEKNA